MNSSYLLIYRIPLGRNWEILHRWGSRWGIVCMLCTAGLRGSACLRSGWNKRWDPEDFKRCAQDVQHSNLLYHSGLLVSCINPYPSQSSFKVMAGHDLSKHLLWEACWNKLQSCYFSQFWLNPDVLLCNSVSDADLQQGLDSGLGCGGLLPWASISAQGVVAAPLLYTIPFTSY